MLQLHAKTENKNIDDCVMLLESITWDSQNDFPGFYKRSINAGTWKSTITNRIQDVVFDGVTSQRQIQSKMAAP